MLLSVKRAVALLIEPGVIMMKTIVKIFAGLVVVFVIAVAGFFYTFDANNYRNEIASMAELATGRPVSIAGDLDVSLEYPWLGIKVSDITIANPPGFGHKPMATIDRFDINLKIIPLLLNRLDIDRLVLHHLKADLVRKASGENNWAGIVDDQAFGFSGLNIASIELKDSSLTWSDDGSGKQYKVLKMGVVTQAVAQDQPLPVEIKALVKSRQPEWQAGVNVKSRLEFNDSAAVVNANDLKLIIKTLLPDTRIGKASLVMAADSIINLESSSVKLNKARIATLGLNMSGSFVINDIFTEPVIQGPLTVGVFDAAKLADKFKVAMPKFANENSLKKISLTAALKTDFDSIYLDDIVANVDESELTGFFHITDSEKRVARYQLTMDKLRLNDYALADDTSATDEASFALQLIRSADLEGTLDAGSVMVDDAELSGFHVTSTVSNGIYHADPITMRVGENEVNAKVKLDVRDPSASLLVAKVNNADANAIINPILKSIAGDEVPTLIGLVDVDAHLVASGINWKSLTRSAKGTIKLDMDKVTVEGFDFDRTARGVVNDYGNRYDFRASKAFMSTFLADSVTEFDGLHATLDVSQGKIVNDDLRLVSEIVTVTGSGSIDFIGGSVDYRPVIDMNVENTANLRDKLRDHPMEYDVRGPFGQLAYNFDADRYDLLVGRMLIQEAKARQYKQINQQKKTRSKSSWTNAVSTK
jgi:AsmA protein